MAVNTLAGGHCCFLFLAADQKEQEREDWTTRKKRLDGKCPAILQAISFLSHTASGEAKQFFLLSGESKKKNQYCIKVVSTSVDMGRG